MTVSRVDLAVAVQTGLARTLDALPASAALRAAGGPVVVDGQTLDPHLAMVLRFEERFRPSPQGRTPQEQRVAIRESARIAAGRPIAVRSVRDLEVDGAEGPLRARLYSPPSTATSPRPLVVFFHGGGWVVGDLDTHDQPCRLISRYADVHVLSVDYRLAPEHPFPAAAEDAVASFDWAVEHAAELGADPTRVAVAGDSAGGNLAAVVAQATRDAGTRQPVAQLLLYPGADGSVSRPSKALFADGFFLTRTQMDWYWDTYRAGAPSTDVRLSPLLNPDLSGLAPTVLTTAAFDPLRDEGEAYAEALRAAGTTVVLRRAAGLVHGYFSMTGIHHASFAESVAVTGAFAALLESAVVPPPTPS
jgi:acetyl esterase